MFELDTPPDINVLESEYKRLLGFPPAYALSGRVRELADWARRWYGENGKPWASVHETALQPTTEKLRINGAEFSAKRLNEQLIETQAHKAMLVAVSAGEECEKKARQLWDEAKPDEYFFLEVYGSAIVEHLIT